MLKHVGTEPGWVMICHTLIFFLCISLSLLTYISPSNNLKYLNEEAGEMAQ